MADAISKPESSAAQGLYAEKEQPPATKLANLRDLAQRHLDEIDEITKVEQMQEKKRIEELENEVRRKERRQQRRSTEGKEQSEGKRSKMRTAQGKSRPRSRVSRIPWRVLSDDQMSSTAYCGILRYE